MEAASSFACIMNAYKSDDSDDDSASNVLSGVAVGFIGPNRWSETRDNVDKNQDVKSSTENRTDSSVRDKHQNDRGGKGGKGIGAEDKKTSVSSRRKRSRSRSSQRSDNKDVSRKRKRRFSETESGSLCVRESRSNGREESKKDKNVGDTLQLKIDQLKEEIERAKQEIGLDRNDLRNKSGSIERKTSHRKRRSQSRSLDNKSSSCTDHRSKSKPSERRVKSPPTSDNR